MKVNRDHPPGKYGIKQRKAEAKMSDFSKEREYRVLKTEDLEKVSGGTVVEDGIAKYGPPRHEGEACPDCGGAAMHFVQYQISGGKVEEVYYAPCCGYFFFRVK